jgi:hypothetical protein
MGNETDPPDELVEDGAAAVVVEDGAEAAVVEDAAAAGVVEDTESATPVTSEAPAAGRKSTIEVVLPERQPPATPPARRPASQIVQLGRRKPKSYLN